jgi:predicted RNA-binding Zn-ribbon protein involved in translation (DUF1610 family)
MQISGRYLRNCLPSLVVTRGSPDHVELYPASKQGGGTPVKWEDYLDSLPELVENRWVFTPKQGIDELEIAYRIGRQSTERHSLKITDGANLWRESPAEEGMGCDIQSVDSSSGEVDISEMFKTSQEEFEKREKYVKLRFGMGFVFEDKDSGVYIAGIGLKDLLKFSRLERRKRLVTPQGPPPVDLVGAKEESMQADLAIKQMANKAAAEKAEAAEKKAEKKAAAKKAAKKKAEAAEKAAKKAKQDRIEKAEEWNNDLKGMQDNMEESEFTPYEVRVNQETLGRAKAAVCASSGTPLVGKGSVSFPCPGCSLPIGRSSRCRVQSVKYICPNCRFEGP